MAFRVARVRGKLSAMLPRHEPAGALRPVKAEMIRSPLRSLFTMIATAPRVSLSHAHRQAQAALLRRGHIADARASCLDIADRPWLFVFVSGCRLRSVVLQLATAGRQSGLAVAQKLLARATRSRASASPSSTASAMS